MVTGRVIQRRYLLQRVVSQDQNCAVYQGFDQVLQRVVAVKIPSAEHGPEYRAAVRVTSQFAHPNIVGVYDLIVEPDQQLYIVQEFVDGDTFQDLLLAQLPLYQVVDLGMQICQALLFAGSPSRKTCHGDLTPAAILRDRNGLVRVNNFALPGDAQYFSAWNVLGGGETIFSDQQLPYGQMTAGRRADDTRALGLLLYQLLSSRASGVTPGEPPADGRMRFMRNVPAELCEVVARTVIRQHPQYISTPEALLPELRTIFEALEPVPVEVATPAYAAEEATRMQQFSPVTSNRYAFPLPTREAVAEVAAPPFPQTSGLLSEVSPSSQTIAGTPHNWATHQGYPQTTAEESPRRINVPVVIILGLVLFALFFVIGLFLAHAILPPL